MTDPYHCRYCDAPPFPVPSVARAHEARVHSDEVEEMT